MTTFKGLEFKAHPVGTGIQAKATFENGRGVSVLQGPGFYGNRVGNTYEVAAIDPNGSIDYTFAQTRDVWAYQTPRQVTRIMRRIARKGAKS